MQFIALIINTVLNIGLLALASSQLWSKGDEGLVTWTTCTWISGALVVMHMIFCVARMAVLWRKGREEASLWGLVILAILPISTYYLWGAYFLAVLVVSGPKVTRCDRLASRMRPPYRN